ncbi:MAG: S1C family serine protease [Holosporales bacterium]|nr:S1C family serine protease [Holosporales bacterium]
MLLKNLATRKRLVRRVEISITLLLAAIAYAQPHAKSEVVLTKKEQRESIKAIADEIERKGVKDIIRKFSGAVALIHTFSAAADEDGLVYNSAIKKRLKKHHYKHGVISGVMLSKDGVVVTTREGAMNSDEIIVSIDSERKKATKDDKFIIGENDYKAKVIKLIPELNLAFLKITPRNNETFQYLKFGNDARLKNDKNRILKNGAVVIGKAKGENFATAINPANRSNNFETFASFVEKLSYIEEQGTPFLAAENVTTGACITPENTGGALIDLTGRLIGLALYRVDRSSFSSQMAIPVSVIKQGAKIAVPNLITVNNSAYLGIKVKDLDNIKIPKTVGKTIGISDDTPKTLGVAVDSVESKSIADNAGIQPEDILLKFNDKIIADAATYNNLENGSFGETAVRLKILRGNKLIEIEINR